MSQTDRTYVNDREHAMRVLRAAAVPDAIIGAAFNVSRQRVAKILGPHPTATDEPTATDDTNLADYLRAWRQRNRITQAKLAAILGTHLQSVSHWERGASKGSLPTLIVRYLDMLEMTGTAK